MKKIMELRKPDSQQIHESLSKGYGIPHPERISGYAGFFIRYGDVFVSDLIACTMDRIPAFHRFIRESVRRFTNDEYGLISQSDKDENIELKWLAGGGPIFGRYAFEERVMPDGEKEAAEIIKIRLYKGNTYILFD